MKYILTSALPIQFLGLFSAGAKEVKIEREWRGNCIAIVAPKDLVIKDRENWGKLWKEMGQNAPAVDFDKFTALACFMGRRNTGGYSIKISSVVELANGLQANIEKRHPGRGPVTMAITGPYHIVLIAKSSKSVEFKAGAKQNLGGAFRLGEKGQKIKPKLELERVK